MKRYRARYTPEAARIIKSLHPQIKTMIRDAIDNLLERPFSSHELQFQLAGFRSSKFKRYRIMYKVNEEEHSIDVYFVGHRRDVYENFRKLIQSKLI